MGLGAKTLLVTLFVLFFGWWYGSTVVPLFFAALLATPAGTMHTFVVGALVWIVLTVALWLRDKGALG